MFAMSLQSGLFTQQQALCSLSTKRSHSTAATQASAAYLKTQQLFEEDRQYALQQQRVASPRIAAAQHSHNSTPSAHQTHDAHTHKQGSGGVALSRSNSDGLSVADSVSSYHGYSGVNYQTGEMLTYILCC